MSLTNQDLLSEAVRTIPAWKQFLQEKRIEQQILLAKMREQEADTVPQTAIGEGVQAGEGETAMPLPGADDPLAWLSDEGDGTHTQREPEDDGSDAGAGVSTNPSPPVSGRTLSERFAPLLGGAPTPRSKRTPAASPPVTLPKPAGPAASSVTPQTPAGATSVTPRPSGEEPAVGPTTPLSDDGTGGDRGRFPTSHLVETPEGEVVETFHRALAESPPSMLPQSVQEAMEREDQVAVAEAFVAAQQEGALPPALDEATTRLAEVDYHFAEAHRHQADEDAEDYGF